MKGFKAFLQHEDTTISKLGVMAKFGGLPLSKNVEDRRAQPAPSYVARVRSNLRSIKNNILGPSVPKLDNDVGGLAKSAQDYIKRNPPKPSYPNPEGFKRWLWPKSEG